MSNPLKTINVSRETLIEARNIYKIHFDEFENYIDELMWWNKKINLVSRNVSRETIREHVVHSLVVVPLGVINGPDEWVDAGTGGGIPGIPLAIVTPDVQWVLNDVVSKKIAAVKQMIHKLNLINAEGEAGDIKNIELNQGAGIITKHAFSVSDLFDLIGEKPWEQVVFYKGADESKIEYEELSIPVKGDLYKFDFGENEPFYKGKGILVLERNE
jgi:16S rRNA (guanine527-N7)-methyltransferase